MIKVEGGGGESPDPAVYCPVNGYILDPSIYTENPIITETPRPPANQIRLIAIDNGSLNNIYFRCTVSNNGKYVVTVTGKDGAIVNTQTSTNNSYLNYNLPILGGYLAENFTYYFIDIAPELATNELLSFAAPINTTSGDSLGSYIIAAFFNAPALTTLASAFINNKRINFIEFLPTMNDLTSLLSFCSGCSDLSKVVFRNGMPALTTLQSAFINTGYITVELPSSLPSVITMQSTFSGSKIKQFIFPDNMPLLANLQGAFSNSEIESVSFPTFFPELMTIYQMFLNCYNLKGIITYPEMPKLTTAEQANYYCKNVEEIIYNGAWNSLSLVGLRNTASDCYKLKKITFPDSITSSLSVTSQSIVDNCGSLEEVVLPTTLILPSYDLSIHFFNNFKGCNRIHTISMIENANTGAQYGRLTYANFITLKRFDQPNTFFTSSSIAFSPAAGIQGKLEFYEIDWDYFNNQMIDFRRQNMSISEIRRILARVNFRANMTYPSYFYLNDNPEWMAVQGYWNPSMVISSGRVMSFSVSVWDSRIRVGSSIFVTQGNGSPQSMEVLANNQFRILATNIVLAPYDGTRMVFYDDYFLQYGVVPGKTYYVVNSENDSGKLFQLSETQNGQPYQFTFGQSPIGLNIKCYADNYVTDISFDGTYYRCTMSFPTITNSGSKYGTFIDSNYFDFFEFYVKNFRPDLFYNL